MRWKGHQQQEKQHAAAAASEPGKFTTYARSVLHALETYGRPGSMNVLTLETYGTPSSMSES